MNNNILTALLNNAILLLALATIYDLATTGNSNERKFLRQILSGIALGGLGIGLIMASFCALPGIIFDTRSVLLSVSGLFFGFIPTVIAMSMTAAYRLSQGGAAAWTGTFVIIATGSIGLIWRRLRKKPLEQIRAGELYIFGIINHVVMLALMFTLPLQTALYIVSYIRLPVLLIYPLATIALGLLLAGRVRRQKNANILAESEETYRNLFRNNPAAMLLIDPETGSIVDANPAACRFYGWPGEKFRQMKIAQISMLPPEKMLAEMQESLSSPRNTLYSRHRLANGSIRDVEVLSGPVFMGGKQLVYSIIQDVTERTRHETEREKAFAEAEQARHTLLSVIEDQKLAEAKLLRLSAAINQAAEGVVITDTKGNIEYVNPAFETISGYSSGEVIDRSPRFLQSGQHNKNFYTNLWETISSGKIWEGRFINKRKDGTLYTEDSTISPVRSSSGIITGYVAVKRDITDELNQEEKFRQSQKMEAVGQLAGGIAHDFNNILQAILGFSEILLLRLNKDSAEYRNAEEIEKAAQRAAELTEQLLAFSRKQPVDKMRLDLSTAIRDAEILLQLLLGGKTVCVLDLAPDLREVYADHSQITQVIMNLAVNARDAMPDGGRLTISTRNVVLESEAVHTLPEAEPGTFVCLSFTDTGCGMSQEVKDHLFEPFFTTKEVGKGTGLGLSVVYGIVKQNKGWIHVYSEKGQGTSFKIYLPACEAAAPKVQADRRHSGRILLVEDDTDTRNLVVRILKTADYEIVAAESAQEALRLFEKEKGRFDLLFSDMVMAGGNGLELADTIREKSPTLPVLLYSGYQDQRERWINIDRKKYLFLQKPFSVASLLATVHDALTGTLR